MKLPLIFSLRSPGFPTLSCRSLLLLLSILLGSLNAKGGTYTFTTAQSPFNSGVLNQGWWSATFQSNNTNDNTYTGTLPAAAALLRSFFTFNLATLPAGETVTGVTMTSNISQVSGAVTVEFFDVSTEVSTLNNNVGTSAAVYNDLGSGTSYGTVPVNSPSNSTVVFPLNSTAHSAVQSAGGGFFSLGCTMNTSGGFIFGSSGSIAATLIVTTVASSTPEIAVLNSLSTNIPDAGSQAFGTTDVAETLTQTFTVNNTGSGALNLTGITFDGTNPGDFTVTTAPGLSTLPATTGTTTFTVTFKPLQSGPRSAVMHIASNDADENPFDITVTGTGLVSQSAVQGY